MDLGIKEIGITFIVGAFFILGLELILFYFFGLQLTGFFQGAWGLTPRKPAQAIQGDNDNGANKQIREETKDHAMKAAVFVGLAFAVGILAENLSFKYVDSVEPPKPLPETINVLDLPSKGDTRVKTLIKNLSGKSPIIEPLATELASNGAFSLADPTDGIAVRNWICGRGQCSPTPDHDCPSSTDNITKSILRVYYYAKNRTFENNNYYDEMKRIQTRVDFSRSIALIALIYCVLALLIVFIGIERAILRRIILRTLLGRICGPKKSDSNLNFIFQSMKANSTKLFITFILFIIYFAGMWSYQRESYEFNKRAFGYYVSMLIKENHNKSIGCEE